MVGPTRNQREFTKSSINSSKTAIIHHNPPCDFLLFDGNQREKLIKNDYADYAAIFNFLQPYFYDLFGAEMPAHCNRVINYAVKR
jgi:hypothetical protein